MEIIWYIYYKEAKQIELDGILKQYNIYSKDWDCNASKTKFTLSLNINKLKEIFGGARIVKTVKPEFGDLYILGITQMKLMYLSKSKSSKNLKIFGYITKYMIDWFDWMYAWQWFVSARIIGIY